MQLRKIAALFAVVVVSTSGTLIAGPASAFVPISKPAPIVETYETVSTPPIPTKQDKAYKPSAREKAGKNGHPNLNTGLKAASTCTTFCYNYATAVQHFPAGTTALGLAANLPVENTYIKTTPAPADYHVLAQLAVQKTGGHAIELGVTRDVGVFGDWQPRIFAGFTKGGVWGGYGTGFVDYAPNTSYTYGSVLPVVPGTHKRFEIRYSGGNFWLGYDLQWIGYIPASVFTAAAPAVTFTSSDLMQAFMEEVGPNYHSCTDLGNGLPASDGLASRLGSMSVIGASPPMTTNFTPYILPTDAIGYSLTSLSTTTVRGGGPGADASLTTVGTTGAC